MKPDHWCPVWVEERRRFGPGNSDDKEGRVLNRVVRWTDDGVEYEADPGQAEKLLDFIGLGSERVKSTVTPGLKPTNEQIDGEKELEQHKHPPYPC